MSADKELNIAVKTTGDTAGVKKVGLSLEELQAIATKTGQSLSSVVAQHAEAQKKAEAATKSAGDAAKQAAKSTNELGENFEKGAAAGRVLSEVARGNVFALAQLGSSIKVIGALLKTNVIGVIVTLGAVVAQVAVPFIRGFGDAKKSIEETGTAADEFKGKLTALEKVAKESLDSQLESVRELRDGYSELLARMDDAMARAKELNKVREELEKSRLDLEEQKQLLGAKTDEDREKIKASFAQKRTTFDQQVSTDRVDGDEQFAKQRVRMAQEEQSRIQRVRDEIGLDLTQKRQASEVATAESGRLLGEAMSTSEEHGGRVTLDDLKGESLWSLRFGDGAERLRKEDPEVIRRFGIAEEANKEALGKRRELELAEKNAEKVRAELAASAKIVDAEMTKFGAQLERVSFERQVQKTKGQVESGKTANENVKANQAADAKIRELASVARQALEAGDFTAQDRAVTEIRRLVAEKKTRRITISEDETPRSTSIPPAPQVTIKDDPPVASIKRGGVDVPIQRGSGQGRVIKDGVEYAVDPATGKLEKQAPAPATTANTSAVQENTAAEKELTSVIKELVDKMDRGGGSDLEGGGEEEKHEIDPGGPTDPTASEPEPEPETEFSDAGPVPAISRREKVRPVTRDVAQVESTGAAAPSQARVQPEQPAGLPSSDQGGPDTSGGTSRQAASDSSAPVVFGRHSGTGRHRARNSVSLVGLRDSENAPAGAPPAVRSTVGLRDETKPRPGTPPLTRSLVKPADGSTTVGPVVESEHTLSDHGTPQLEAFLSETGANMSQAFSRGESQPQQRGKAATDKPDSNDQTNALLKELIAEVKKLHGGGSSRGPDGSAAFARHAGATQDAFRAVEQSTQRIIKQADTLRRQIENSR